MNEKHLVSNDINRYGNDFVRTDITKYYNISSFNSRRRRKKFKVVESENFALEDNTTQKKAEKTYT